MDNGNAVKPPRKIRRLNLDKATKLTRWFIESGHKCESLSRQEAYDAATAELGLPNMPEQSFDMVAKSVGVKFKPRAVVQPGKPASPSSLRDKETRRFVRRVAEAVQRVRSEFGLPPDDDMAYMLERMASSELGQERRRAEAEAAAGGSPA